MSFGLIFLALVLIGLGFYLFKYGLAKKHTGYAYVQSLTQNVQAVQKNNVVYIQIPLKINNVHASIEVPQSEMHKYHYGKKIHVEYRTNKENKITLVTELKNAPKQPEFIINKSAKTKMEDYEKKDNTGSSQYWD